MGPESDEGRIVALERELAEIRERNRRVELDKGWEVSVTRRTFLAVMTYLCAAVLLRRLGIDHYLRNALVPAVGYVLSTLTLPPLKRRWIERRERSPERVEREARATVSRAHEPWHPESH